MASSSEANLSNDFDIDEVINWDEQNYSSKGIDFQLPQLGLPSDTKTSQNTAVTLPNLTSATNQQTSLPGSQTSYFQSFFGATPQTSIVRTPKNHGFPPRQAMVSPNALSFPSNINIPSITPASSNASLLPFDSNLVRQNVSLASQLGMPALQNVQNSGSLINDSPFADHGIDDNTDLVEGPLDRIVDQIMDRQNSESTFDDDTPVITYSNSQTKSLQQSNSRVSPQNAQSMNVLPSNAPARTVDSPNQQSTQNIPMRSIPSPNTPSQPVSSTGNQNISNLSRNVLVQKTSEVIQANISPPNVQSQNLLVQNASSQKSLSPSGQSQHHSSSSYPTMPGLGSQSEQSIASHASFRLQPSVSSSASMGPSALIGNPTNLALSDSNSLFSPTGQRNNQSFPSFMLQNPNQTLIGQAGNLSQGNAQTKPAWHQSGSNLDDLLRMQTQIRNSSPNIVQKDFANQLVRSSSNFSSVLTSEIPSEQSNMPSFMNTAIVTERPVSVSSVDDVNLEMTTANALDPSQSSVTGMNVVAESMINTTLNNPALQNRASESDPISSLLQTTKPQSFSGQAVNTSVPESFPGQALNNFPSTISSSLSSSDELRTSISDDIQNLHDALESTQPLTRSGSETVNPFFVQNSLDANRPTAEMKMQENVLPSQSQSIVSNNVTQGKVFMATETPVKPQQSNSVFTLVTSTTQLSNTPNKSPSTILFRNQTARPGNPANSSQSTISAQSIRPATQPAGIKTIRITSPAASTSGFKYPTVGFGPRKAVSIQSPRAQTIRLQSPTSTSAFPTFRLTQITVPSTNTSKKPPMVFTLAPGSNAAATLKNLPANLKDKLTGRQVIFLQQPTSKSINTTKPQPMKIVFVNDGSIGQVVSGPVKSKGIGAAPSETPGQTASASSAPPSAESKPVPSTATPTGQDEADSPASVNSTDSDSLSIAALKENEELKKKELADMKDAGTEPKRRKRRKDPNRPVKPLSSFQRFFQASQPTIRQQNPQATFAEVSKTIKEMWEGLNPKDKKVYQDAWRLERVQYKKAMEDYNALEVESDSPSPKHAKIGEMKGDVVPANPFSDARPNKTENISSPVGRTPVSPTVGKISPAATAVSSVPAPRTTGKPLAMMAEMANKTKLASAAAKATAMIKHHHHGKTKASNGVEESHIIKKKAKINPIPKKICIRAHCNKPAKTTKERGTMFCSDDCVMRHCRGIFKSWVETRRGTLQAAT